MTLKRWLEKNKMSQNAFSKSVGRDPSVINRICSGETKPEWSTMERILLATAGAVKPNDFLTAK